MELFYVSVVVSGPQAAFYGATVYYGDHQVMHTQMTLTLCPGEPSDACNPPDRLQH